MGDGISLGQRVRESLIRFRQLGHRHRGRLSVVSFAITLSALVACGSMLGGTVAPAAAAGCPNEAIRSEQGEAGLALPDCRAYEMVSPQGSAPVKETSGMAAALNGERVTYRSWNPYTGQENESLRYIAERGADGWTIHNPTPAQNGAKSSKTFACDASFAVTPEQDHLLLVDGYHSEGLSELPHEGEECLGDEPPLVSGEPRGYANIFRTDPAGSSYQLLNMPPLGVEGNNGRLQGFNADASVVTFSERAQLTPDAPEPLPLEGNEDKEEDLYVWHDGTTRYVAYLPDGTPVLGYFANAGGSHRTSHINIANLTHGMSTDGERIVFESQSKLYLREHALRAPSAISGGLCTEPAKACTIPIDVSEEGPSEIRFGGERLIYNRAFEYATPDLSRIFFMDARKLTPDANTALPVQNEFFEDVNAKADLYEFNVATGETRDLTANAAEPAAVRGLAGASEDGSYIYFAAYGDLTGGQENSEGETAVAGKANLYLLHNGSTTYIATMAGGELGPSGGESSDWQETGNPATAIESVRGLNSGRLTSRFSRNGKHFAFLSAVSLTGFDNQPQPGGCEQVEPGTVPGSGCTEMFVYDAETNQLECASCSPEGERPIDGMRLEGPGEALEPTGLSVGPTYMPHAVSEDGAVFFQTPNPLLPGDTNGALDVYEFEHGELHLISTGKGLGPSRFVDADADGSNVFFDGGQSLVGRDTDESNTLYDARVDGGFVEPPALPGCEDEACRGASTAKGDEVAAGTPSFSGPGNQVEKPKKDCKSVSARAKKLSQKAKKLNRQAAKASGAHATKLKRQAAKYAKQGNKVSKQAKACRRSNKGGK